MNYASRWRKKRLAECFGASPLRWPLTASQKQARNRKRLKEQSRRLLMRQTPPIQAP